MEANVTTDQPPIRLEISINGEVAAVAGVETLGVVHAMVDWVADAEAEQPTRFTRYELNVGASGLDSVSGESIKWVDRKLKIGDVVKIRVLRNVAATAPRGRRPRPTAIQQARRDLTSLIAGLEKRAGEAPDLLLTGFDGELITTRHVLRDVIDSGSSAFDEIELIPAPILVGDLLEITRAMQMAVGPLTCRKNDDGDEA